MDRNTEAKTILTKSSVEDEDKWKRPPSSYGSMKSDSEEDEEVARKPEEEGEQTPAVLPELPPQVETRVQMVHSEYPETLYTMTTLQTKPAEAMVIDTSSLDLGDAPEDDDDDDEEEDEYLITNSPEPPDPIEMEDLTQSEGSQPGRRHPEQDLPYLFKSMQTVLMGLSAEELFKYRMLFHDTERKITFTKVMDGDVLDFVDSIIEVLGQERALMHTIETLKHMDKKEEAEKLRELCRKALLGFSMKRHIIRKYKYVHEGVVRAGQQILLDFVYVAPQMTTQIYGGIDPSHELRPQPPTPIQAPSPDTFTALSDLFRMQREDGTPVRTVVTTGLPAVGMTFSVAKFSLDWAEERTYWDIHFIIKMSFRSIWFLRNKETPTQKRSFYDMIRYYYPDLKDKLKITEEPDFKTLIIMDSFDAYETQLDWENTPEITDCSTPDHHDAVVVNIIRGNLLPGARLWILGRPTAVSQIPSKFVDVATELQGFSDDTKDEYLMKHLPSEELAAKVVRQYKRVPMLRILARHPFMCWIVSRDFKRAYRDPRYGKDPPRLTPFLLSMMMALMNRWKEFYDESSESKSWSFEDLQSVASIGKMALKMLEKSTDVFFEEDVKEVGLPLMEVVVFSGFCTELPAPSPGSRRTFAFMHFTFQEFLAALYVFMMFRLESKNVLDTGLFQFPKIFKFKNPGKPAAGLVECALARTLASPPGQYDMFLRYLCGLLSEACHDDQLKGNFYRHNCLKVEGLEDVQRVLEQAVETAPRDREENLKECLRELTQRDR